MTKITLSYNFATEEELRAHLGGENRSEATVVGTTTPVTVAPETVVSTDAVDADGMKYDADIHSNPPVFTTDGLWRARKGKADAAAAARAAFKAAGGTVVAPVITAAPVMPGLAAAPVMPGLPGSAPVRQEPVTIEQLMTKASEVMASGKATAETFSGLYAKLGITDINVFNTNETLRAAMLAELNTL